MDGLGDFETALPDLSQIPLTDLLNLDSTRDPQWAAVLIRISAAAVEAVSRGQTRDCCGPHHCGW